MTTGETVRILATDPGAVDDFESFAKQTGNELLDSTKVEGEFHFTLKKLT